MGKFTGEGIEYNGKKKKYEGSFKEGEKNGEGKEFINNDKDHFLEGEFIKNKKNGIFNEYRNKIIIAEKEYLDNILIKGKELNERGKIIFDGIYKDNHRYEGIFKEYYDESFFESEKEDKEFLKKEGEYKKGKIWNGKLYQYSSFTEKEYIYSKGEITNIKIYIIEKKNIN